MPLALLFSVLSVITPTDVSTDETADGGEKSGGDLRDTGHYLQPAYLFK